MTNILPYNWTDERVEQLKQLVKKGMSFAQIALIMGCVSRNVPLCKWSRIKAKDHNLKHPRLRMGGRNPRNAAPIIKHLPNKAPPVPSNDNIVPVTIDGERITEENCGHNQCRFPIGDPCQSDFQYCGRPKKEGSSYCETHHAKVYRKFEKRPPKEKQASGSKRNWW